MMKRIIADIVLFLSVFFAPWYFTALLAFLFVVLFPKFWEAVLAGLFLDAMYGGETAGVYGRFGLFTAISAIVVFAIERVKRQIRI
ncbi:MAG: hypothetical protein GXP44_02345 [bacterium]|nr:hypothetical protein [bacterium]